MKKHLYDSLGIAAIICVVLVFFYKTIIYGLLPVPSDTLVGLYHPYRVAYLNEYTRGVPFKNFLITDPVRQQIPWRKQVVEYWKKGVVPSWDAWSFSGTTLIGNIQAGSFYPLNILFFIFSFPIAWSILIMSQPLLAGIFLYIFLRNKKLDIIPSLIGSIAFAFGGYSISWMTWGTIVSTFLWTPIMLFAVDKIHTDNKTWKWKTVLLFALLSSFFAGHLQFFIYSFVFMMWYAFWEYWKPRIYKLTWWHGIILGLFLLITGVQWIPMFRFLPTTSRVVGAAYLHEGFFIPIQHLIQFIAPDYFGNPATLNYWGVWNYGETTGYIGVIALTLAFLGIGKKTLIWIVPIVVSLIFAVESPISKLPFVLHIPIIDVFQPTRLLAVVGLCLSILAAYGASKVFSLSKKYKLSILLAIGLLFVTAWFFSDNPVARRNLILPIILFATIVFGIVLSLFVQKTKWMKTVILCAFFAISVFDLFRFGWKFTPFTSQSYFFPETAVISFLKQQSQPFRVMVLDDRALPPNVLTYYGIESISGYDPIHSSRYEEFIAAMERGEPNIIPPFGFERIMTPKNYSSPLLNLLGVKYVIAMKQIDNPNLRLMLQEGETIVYKNIDFSPRVYLADTILVKKTKQEIINGLYGKDYISGRTAIVETELPIVSVPLSSSEGVSMTSYASNKIVLDVTAINNRLLVIGNTYDSGWKITIDGKKTEVYKINYLFFGVIVPKGKHKIDIIYSSL